MFLSLAWITFETFSRKCFFRPNVSSETRFHIYLRCGGSWQVRNFISFAMCRRKRKIPEHDGGKSFKAFVRYNETKYFHVETKKGREILLLLMICLVGLLRVLSKPRYADLAGQFPFQLISSSITSSDARCSGKLNPV